MFDFVRQHTKIMMGLMFLLIIPSFVLFGIDGYNRFRDTGETVARVGAHEVSQGEWDSAHRSEAQRLQSAMPQLDPKLLDTPQARYATLERLVREKVLEQSAQDARLVTSDARLARELQQDQTIASLRRPDGTLDMERYKQLAASQGLSPEGFEARIRREISLRQVETGVTATALSLSSAAEVALNAFFETREVQLANFDAADYAAKVSPSDAELAAFYAANQPLFQAAEAASVEYLVLDLESVKKTIVLNAADLQTYYEQNLARLSGAEERRASHILINAAKDMPAAQREQAKIRALELLKEARKAPEQFAALATRHSQDSGSAAKGGDLDFFNRAAMVKPFADAAFALEKGQISELVESEFGFHIIKLTDIKSPRQRSFEELRPAMEADLKTQQAQRRFAEIAEQFSNSVYEQSDSLKPIADKLKLELKSQTAVTRQPAPGAKGVLSNPKFLEKLFSADSIEKKRNTEAVEVGPSQLVSGRITQYAAAHTRPLAEVRDSVRNRLVAARAAELAQQDGAAKLAAWKASPDSATLQPVVVVSRDQARNLPQQVVTAVLRADASRLPAWVGIDLGPQGYRVARINKVVARTPAAPEALKQDRAQYAKWWANAENDAYYELLKERQKVQIKVARPGGMAIDAQGVSQP